MPQRLKVLQDALTGENAPFRWMIEHLRDVVVLLRADGTLAYLSPAYERTLGRDPATLVGLHALDLIHPEDREAAAEALSAVLAEPGVSRSVRYRHQHADGSWRHFEATGTLLPMETLGECILVVARDVSEAREANAAMRTIFRRTLQAGPREARSMRDTGRRLAAEVHAACMEGFLAAFGEMGLGELRLVEARGDRYVVGGAGLLEHRAQASQPTCSLPLGYLEAAAGIVTGHAGLGTELECQSLGHERCLFVVRARNAA